MKQVTRNSEKSISVALTKFTIAIVLFIIATEFCDAQITSTFSTDAEGWTMSDVNLNTPFTVNHNLTGGNPGGYVSASGTSSQPYYFTSPAKFNGNIVYFCYGQDLKFDIQINHTPTTHSVYGDVEIRNNSGSYLTYTLPSFPAVAPVWSTFTVRLDETSNWRINSTGGPIATKQQVLQFLSNIQCFRININYGTATLAGAIDNVILQQRTITAAPAITSFTPDTGKPGTSVTINGSGFASTASQNVVYFGAIAGTITSASSTQLVVTVPVGAQHGVIKVINKITGLTKQSDSPFSPTFDYGGRIIPASFKSKFDIPTVQSGGISIGDLDGDGWSEIIMAHADNSKVEVYRNLGLGGKLTAASFASKITFPTNQFFTNGAGMKVVDLDGDGKLDLTTSGWNGGCCGQGGVFVTFRNVSTIGNIAFETAEQWNGVTDESPVYDVTDVDGDGLPELIGGEGGSGGTFWIDQNMSIPGNIEFAPPAMFLGGTIIGNVNTATDLDNDGKPELIVVQAATITIIKNTSTPGVISLGSTTILPYSGDSNVELYDFNGDGKKDLIFGNFYTGDDIRIHVNTNTGGALAISDFATEIILKSELGYTNRGISLADMNGDGKVEIVAVDHGNIGVFENITNGILTANSFIEAYVKDGGGGSTYPNKLVVGDLNADGKPDIVMATTNASYRITVFENNNVKTPHISLNTVSPLKGAIGSSVTITGDYFSTIPSENTVMFGDVKAVVSSATNTQLIVTVPPGASMAAVSVTRDQLTAIYHLPFVPTFSPGVNFINTHFAPPIDFTLTGALYEVDAGDLNNDGKVDVVGYGDFAGNAIAFRNTHASGTISLSSLLADDTVTSVPYPRIFDLDGDGFMDMLTASGSCRNVSVGSEIKFNTYAYISPGGYFYNDFADFNNDGKVDIVGVQSSTVAVNENRTTTGDFITTIPFATFSDSYFFTKPSSGGATIAADFDNDGLADFAATNSGSDNVSVWKNNGAYRISLSQFTAQPTIVVGNNPSRIYKSDFDVDGKVDLMLYYGTGTSSTSISVLHNTSTAGSISFARFDFTIPALATIAHVNDLDGDGKPDILITSETTDQFFILKNTATAGVMNASSFAAPFIMAVNNPRGITTADLTLDGKPDIIITSAPNSLLVFENLIPTGPSITINSQPASIAVCSGANVSLTVAASGTTNLLYQWQKFDGSVFTNITNGNGFSGATTATLSINTSGNFGEGDYQCMVSGDASASVFSSTATLTFTTSTTVAEITVNGNVLTASPGDSYQWYQNGDEISGATNQSFELNVLEYGVYRVDVTDNGCTSTSAEFEYLITGAENFRSELKVYPNPTDEYLSIEFNPPYNLYVIDITGKLVRQLNVKTKSTQIDLSFLSKGIYLLQIRNDHTKHNLRISKD